MSTLSLRAALTVLPVSLVALALAIFNLAALGPPAADDPPAAVAAFASGNRITVQLSLPAGKPERAERAGLAVELLGRGGKLLEKRPLLTDEKKDDLPGVTFTRPTNALGPFTIRTRQGRKTVEVPLARILLVRAHETALAGSTDLFAGSRTALRVRVSGARSISETVPLVSLVTVRLHAEKKVLPLYRGTTGSDGVADVHFEVPELATGAYTLEVLTKSALGEEKVRRSVNVRPGARVLLTTDKPLYQPGQTLHLRALVLRAFDLGPVGGKDLTLEVEDGKGNKVFKKVLKTSNYGIAAADFTLAEEVNPGDWRVRAVLEQQQTDKTVTVKRYVLPRFKARLKTDRTFYLPREVIKGELQVDYFFGKPVAGATVEVKASTFDVAFKPFATFKGKTDRNGHVTFEVTLPGYFVGLPLAKGNAMVRLQATVTDSAEHTERVGQMIPVSDRPIRISLIPEAGRLVPGVENTLFVAALYPDGRPAICSVGVWAGKAARGKPLAKLETNEAGLAEMKLVPAPGQLHVGKVGEQTTNLFEVTTVARDSKGNGAMTRAALTVEPLGENILLRLDRALCKAGESLDVEVRASAGMSTVYLDVIKAGQVVLTRWLDVKDALARTKLELPANLCGTLEVHAYQVVGGGEVIRDSRIVYVNPADQLTVKMSADKDSYLPGRKAIVRFDVCDFGGKPTPAALGVLVVDEAVYALQEMQPGLEKVFFTLQKELLQPRVSSDFKPRQELADLVRGVGPQVRLPGGNERIRQPAIHPRQQQIARVLFASARPRVSGTRPIDPDEDFRTASNEKGSIRGLPGTWIIDPDASRKQKLAEQIKVLGDVLFDYALGQSTVLRKNAETKSHEFRSDLLARAMRQEKWASNLLENPLGKTLTLDDLIRLEPALAPGPFALALTEVRLTRLGYELKQTAQGLTSRRYPRLDAWGRPIRIVKRTAKERRREGIIGLPAYTVVSAGPDGKFGTEDDVYYRPIRSDGLGREWWRMRLVGVVETRLVRRDRFLSLGPHFGRVANLGNGLNMGGGVGGLGGLGALGGGLGALGGGLGALRGAPNLGGMGAPGGGFRRPNRGGAPGDRSIPIASTTLGPVAAPPRVRESFPETLLWQPALITDEKGHATLEVPLADSITTWRLSASASSRTGLLGGGTLPLRVFQDFFVEPDLPVALTQNDEIAFPVAVFNYLKEKQTVTLTLKKEGWFELLDGGFKRTLTLEANEVKAIHFRIKAKHVGNLPLEVEARGSKMADAVRRLVEVLPDGKPSEQVFGDRLRGTIRHRLHVPKTAIEGASRLYVKVYPGVMSQVIEGLDGMLRMPTGCFEQTSSSAYPNILIIDYLKKLRRGSPALMLRAEALLSAGYQKLLTFERPGGGFDWWGSGEPLIWLSAYGLQEFADMARVYPVDPAINRRTRAWLMKKQAANGTWSSAGTADARPFAAIGDEKLLLTSYVTWSLLSSRTQPAGWQNTPEYARLAKAIEYIREQAPRAENAYALALSANALACWDAKDKGTFAVLDRVLKKLDGKKVIQPDGKAIAFPADGQSLSHGRDDSLTVETTALTVLAMVKHGRFTSSVNQALTYLARSRGRRGHWGSTQATILALKALLAGTIEGAGESTPFVIKVHGKKAAEGKVTKDNPDVMQQFDLKEYLQPGDNEVSVEVKGDTALMYQVVGRVFLPHARQTTRARPTFEIDLGFDRTKLSTKDRIEATATLTYRGKTPTFNVIVELPIPPGFTADPADFATMVGAKKVQKFALTARGAILYLGSVKPGEKHSFVWSLRPKYPVKVGAPAAVVYEYYTPASRAQTKPVLLTVEGGK